MAQGTWERASGWAFIAFGVLLLVGAFIPGAPPSIDAGPKVIQRFYVDHGDSQALANFLIGLAALCYFLALPGLWAFVERRGGSALAVSAVAAGVAGTALALAGTAIFQGQALGAPSIQDPGAVFLTEVIARTARNFTYFPNAVVIAAVSAAILRGGGARLAARAGQAVAVICLLGTLQIGIRTTPLQLLSLLALVVFALWYMWLGVMIARADVSSVPGAHSPRSG